MISSKRCRRGRGSGSPRSGARRRSRVAAEDADGAVAVAPPDVLHVDVEDAVGEAADELDVVDALVAEVRRVVVEAEALVALDRLDARARRTRCRTRSRSGAPRGAKLTSSLVELVEDRPKRVGEVVEARLPVLLGGRREGVDRVPDARAGEAVDDARRRTPRRGLRGAARSPRRRACGRPRARRRPRRRGGRIALCRSSMRSQTAWPTRWLEIAWHSQAVLLEQARAGGRRSLVVERARRRRSGRPSRRARRRRSRSAWRAARAPRAAGRPTGR